MYNNPALCLPFDNTLQVHGSSLTLLLHSAKLEVSQEVEMTFKYPVQLCSLWPVWVFPQLGSRWTTHLNSYLISSPERSAFCADDAAVWVTFRRFIIFTLWGQKRIKKSKKVMTLVFCSNSWLVRSSQSWTDMYLQAILMFFNALSIILSIKIGASDSYSITIHLCFFRWGDITPRCHSSCASYWLCLTEVLSSAAHVP